MAAYTDAAATERFADLIVEGFDAAEREVEVSDGSEGGYLVPEGETLLVTDHQTGNEYLITVQKVV